MLTLPFPRKLKSWWRRVNASRRALPQARHWAGGIALVSQEEVLVKGDLLSICAAIRALEPGFACGAATVTVFDAVMKEHPEYAPRMVVNLHPLNGACTGPWAVFSGSNLTKSDELAVLDQAGLPVPRWQLLSPGDKVDERNFGPYVVVKPDDGLRGACVRVCKTRQVKSDPIFVTVNQKTSAPLVQAYIHTGPRAVSHRVGVLFGRAIYRWKLTAREIPGRELPADGDFRSKSGATVVSSGKGSVFTDVLEPDVVELAERAAAALPDVPLLGVDIVRRQSDGQLFIIELNSSGYCFHLTSELGLKIQSSMGLDFMAQYGGYAHVATQYLRHYHKLITSDGPTG